METHLLRLWLSILHLLLLRLESHPHPGIPQEMITAVRTEVLLPSQQLLLQDPPDDLENLLREDSTIIQQIRVLCDRLVHLYDQSLNAVQ
jgi:hypothetical protein